MRTLFLECNMGASGDMLMGALLDLLPSSEEFVDIMNHLGLPGVKIEVEKNDEHGIMATNVHVLIDGAEGDSPIKENSSRHDHHHADLPEVESIISDLPFSEKVKRDSLAVYRLIAEAESHVHGRPADHIHFHELGSLDAIVDITGVAYLMEQLSPDKISATPVHVGSGTVVCAHGVLPVPAPATAYLLQGIPIYGGSIKGELCTPTGAALLKYFVHEFGNMPLMCVKNTGYGRGKKYFGALNCVRAMLSEENPYYTFTEIG